MNAQEAIENMASKLNKLNDLKLMLESEGKTEEIEYINLCENIKAFSIVLESAKVLHRHIIPKVKSDYNEAGFTTAQSFYGVPLEELGIEEGAGE